MAILRNPLNGDFTQVPNQLIEDKGVSDKSFRILIYLFSRPDSWKINNSDLQRRFDIKTRSTMANKWKELQSSGWVTRLESDRTGGRFTGYDYRLNISPCINETNTEGNRVRSNGVRSADTHSNTENNNTDKKSNTEFKKPTFEELWNYFVNNSGFSVAGAKDQATRFLNHYEKVDWRVKVNGVLMPMQKWKSAAAGWAKRGKQNAKFFRQPSEKKFKSKGGGF